MFIETLPAEVKTTIYVSVAGIITAAVSKWVTKRADKHKDDLAEHLQLRKELREELDSVKEECERSRAEIDTWKSKYYTELQNCIELHKTKHDPDTTDISYTSDIGP